MTPASRRDPERWRERFLAKVDERAPDDCWPFTGLAGANSRTGHRQFYKHGRMVLAHRVAWEIHYGAPPPPGMVIRHSCDNPPCCNPSHLAIGTVADNNRDRDVRGRHVALSGEGNGFARLTSDDVLSIRHLIESGLPQTKIAERFGITQSNVSCIATGKTWGHVR